VLRCVNIVDALPCFLFSLFSANCCCPDVSTRVGVGEGGGGGGGVGGVLTLPIIILF